MQRAAYKACKATYFERLSTLVYRLTRRGADCSYKNHALRYEMLKELRAWRERCAAVFNRTPSGKALLEAQRSADVARNKLASLSHALRAKQQRGAGAAGDATAAAANHAKAVQNMQQSIAKYEAEVVRHSAAIERHTRAAEERAELHLLREFDAAFAEFDARWHLVDVNNRIVQCERDDGARSNKAG